MKKDYIKKDFPVSKVRRYLEPGPIVLVSTKWKDATNIMTLGWHTVMEFTPSLIGCLISSGNYSYELVKASKECVINLPTADMINTIAGIGTTSGARLDKFKEFELTPKTGEKVKAPLIKECYANFECKVIDVSLLSKYDFFIMEVVKVHVATTPKYPETVHYTGEGKFMVSGRHIVVPKKYRSLM